MAAPVMAVIQVERLKNSWISATWNSLGARKPPGSPPAIPIRVGDDEAFAVLAGDHTGRKAENDPGDDAHDRLLRMQ
jgi:hypothetical protein